MTDANTLNKLQQKNSEYHIEQINQANFKVYGLSLIHI